MVESIRAYVLLSGIWVRSTMAYRTSFVIMTVSQFAITFVDFVALLVMFSRVDQLGGFSLSEIALLYGTSSLALGVADLALGNIEHLGRRVRDGSFDQMLIRPVPALVSMCADRFALRRVGRVGQGALVLGWALLNAPVDWTAARVVMTMAMVLSATLIFASIFVLGGAIQFWSSDSAEVANAFTYGGNFLTQYPMAIYPAELVRGVTFLIPVAFVNWYPTLYLLDRPDPFGFPSVLRFLSPAVAVLVVAVTGLVWRTGLRRYRSTGS